MSITVHLLASDGTTHDLVLDDPIVTPQAPTWPGPSNTGVPAGTTLTRVPQDITSGTGWHWDAGGGNLVVNTAGTVIDSLQVAGTIQVTASNVIIKSCKLAYSGGGGNNFGIELRHANDTTVQDCEISSLVPAGGADDNRLTEGIKDIYGDTTGTVIKRCNIYDCSGGIGLAKGTVQGNYIHNMAYNSTDHVDCYQSFDIGPLEVSGNTFLNENDQTACILLQWTDTTASGVRIHDNLFAGGGYCIYGGDNATDVQIKDNRFSTRFYANGGYYGVLAHWQAANTGNVWSGNVWDDGLNVGQTISD